MNLKSYTIIDLFDHKFWFGIMSCITDQKSQWFIHKFKLIIQPADTLFLIYFTHFTPTDVAVGPLTFHLHY